LNQKQSFEYFDAPWSVGNSHRTWRFDGRHFISAALSEPYTERNGQRMSEFDNLEKAAARRFSGGEVGELNGGGRDGGSDPASPDDRPGGPAVTLFIDVLGPSDCIASEQED